MKPKRLKELIKVPVPQHLLDTADKQRWMCKTCGIVEPLLVRDNLYLRRRCDCEKAAAERQTQEKILQEQRRIQAAYTFNWLGPGYEVKGPASKTFESFSRELDPRAFKACVKFAEHPEGTFCLFGSAGCGKTHLVAAICHSLHSTSCSCLYAEWPRLVACMKQMLSDRGDYISLVRKAATTRVLVLDDLDRGKPGVDFDHQIARMIIGDREQAGLPTVVTCHHKISELGPFIGEDAISRLCPGLITVPMSNKDFRQRRV